MEKIASLFFIFFIFVSTAVYANVEYNAKINEFDKSFNLAKPEKKLKLHHDLKNIYIQSIIKSDEKLKIEVLQRLIKSSKALNLDYLPYEKELNSLGKSVPKNVKKPPQQLPNNKKPPKNIPSKIDKIDNAKISKNTPLRITKVENLNNYIKIEFNRNISLDEIKSFGLKTPTHLREVFDIKAILMGASRKFNTKSFDEIRIAQFNKDTVRIVFSKKTKFKIEKNIDNNKLILGISLGDKKDNQKNNINKNNINKNNTNKNNSNKNNVNKNTSFKASSKIIVIDPGHGGKDVGAVGGKNIYEKNIALKIALEVGAQLKQKGYKVHFTRTKDVFINLRQRTKIANEKKADLFLSIHANAAPNKSKNSSMQGVETFFLSPARSQRSKNVAAKENKSDIDEMNFFSRQTFLNFLNREKIIASNKLAIDIQDKVLKNLRKNQYIVVDGGVREAPFWVLVGASMPAILLEVGYVTHPTEGKRLNTKKYQDSMAQGIVQGVDEYFKKNF